MPLGGVYDLYIPSLQLVFLCIWKKKKEKELIRNCRTWTNGFGLRNWPFPLPHFSKLFSFSPPFSHFHRNVYLSRGFFCAASLHCARISSSSSLKTISLFIQRQNGAYFLDKDAGLWTPTFDSFFPSSLTTVVSKRSLLKRVNQAAKTRSCCDNPRKNCRFWKTCLHATYTCKRVVKRLFYLFVYK